MKLKAIREGVVDVARHDIIKTNNEIASKIAHAILIVFKKNPNIEFADGPDDPVSLNLRLEPESLNITVISDTKIKLEVSERFANYINVPRIRDYLSVDDLMKDLIDLKASLKHRIKHEG